MNLKKAISLASMAILLLISTQLRSDQLLKNNPLETTVSQLVRSPDKYLDKLVRVQAWAVFGWEGGYEFLSDANPTVAPPSPPARLWLGPREPMLKLVGNRDRAHGWFTGYLRRDPRPMNWIFGDSRLRFETTAVSLTDPQPTSLADAIFQRDPAAVHRVAQSGINLNVWDEYASLPLFHAIEIGNLEIVDELLACGADPKLETIYKETTLASAGWNCEVAIAERLIARGVAVNGTDYHGQTPLILASQTCKDGKMVELLLKAGADPNTKTQSGSTALMAANSNPAATRLLLDAGADPSAKDQYGHTAMDRSCDRGREDFSRVCALLKDALAGREH